MNKKYSYQASHILKSIIFRLLSKQKF